MKRLLVIGQCLAREVPEKMVAAVLAARNVDRTKNAPLEGGAPTKLEGRCNALRTVYHDRGSLSCSL